MVRITFKGDFTKWTALDFFPLLIRNHIRDSFSLFVSPSPKAHHFECLCKEGARRGGGSDRKLKGDVVLYPFPRLQRVKKQASFTTPLPGDHFMVTKQSIHCKGTKKLLSQLKSRNLCSFFLYDLKPDMTTCLLCALLV